MDHNPMPAVERALVDRPSDELADLAGHSPDQQEQKAAFNELFRRLWPKSVQWAAAAGLENAGAEDAAVNGWLRVWRHRTAYRRRRGPYEPWLYTCVVRESRRSMRQNTGRRAREVSAWHLDSNPAEPFEPIEGRVLGHVWDALRELAAGKPHLLELIHMIGDGYRYDEIAEILHLAPGTVASSLFRARQAVAKHLADQGLVFLPCDQQESLARLGIKPVCQLLGGALYRLDIELGVFAGPRSGSAPPYAAYLCEGFHQRLWYYPPEHFQLFRRNDAPPWIGAKPLKWHNLLIYRAVECGTSPKSGRDAYGQSSA